MAAVMKYRRVFPDILGYFDQLISLSYLADLNAQFRGCLLENSGRVAERTMFAANCYGYSTPSRASIRVSSRSLRLLLTESVLRYISSTDSLITIFV